MEKESYLREIGVNEKGWCEKGYPIGCIANVRGYGLGAPPPSHSREIILYNLCHHTVKRKYHGGNVVRGRGGVAKAQKAYALPGHVPCVKS